MRKSRKILLACFGLCLILVVTAVYQIEKRVKKDKQIQIVMITKIIDDSNDFWSALIAGAQMAADEYDVQLILDAPESEDDIEQQNQLILNYAEMQPDVIVLAPADYQKTTEAVRKIKENNIELVLVDSMIDEELADAVVHTDNIVAGEKMGEFIKPYIEADTVIGVVAHVKNSSTAIEREEGLRAGLGDDQDRIADVVFCDSDYEKAYQVTIELFEKYPEITVLAGLNEYSAVGAARAVKELGLEKEVAVIGFDSSIEQIQLLEEGVFQGIIIQKPFNMGYLSIQEAVRAATGSSKGGVIDSGSEVITKENMLTEENQKLLFPFWGS